MISIIMSCYKESLPTLQDSIGSIFDNKRSDVELVLVIDNPSNVDAVRWSKGLMSNHGNIKILLNDCNIGLARSLNKAIDSAEGKYMCRMDADDVAEPNRIDTQLAFVRDNNLDLAGARVAVVDDNDDLLYETPYLPERPESVSKALKFNNCVPHPTWFGKADIFKMHYRNIPLCEDYDFLLRGVLDGCRIGNTNQQLLRYRMTPKSISRSNLYKQYLCQVALSKQYRKGMCVDVAWLEKQVGLQSNQAESIKYTKSNELFNEALVSLRNKKFFEALKSLVLSAANSRAYANKIYRLLRASLYSNR